MQLGAACPAAALGWCTDGELLEVQAVVAWGQEPSPQGLLGPHRATGSPEQCHLVCTQLPPGGSGRDHQPDGELLGVEMMWDLSCRFSVGNLTEVLQRNWFSPNCHACLYFDNLLIVHPQTCQRFSVIVPLFSLVWLGK